MHVLHDFERLSFNFCLFHSVSDGKSCFSIRKSISTSEWRAEHPFAGRNTQQLTVPHFHWRHCSHPVPLRLQQSFRAPVLPAGPNETNPGRFRNFRDLPFLHRLPGDGVESGWNEVDRHPVKRRLVKTRFKIYTGGR